MLETKPEEQPLFIAEQSLQPPPLFGNLGPWWFDALSDVFGLEGTVNLLWISDSLKPSKAHQALCVWDPSPRYRDGQGLLCSFASGDQRLTLGAIHFVFFCETNFLDLILNSPIRLRGLTSKPGRPGFSPVDYKCVPLLTFLWVLRMETILCGKPLSPPSHLSSPGLSFFFVLWGGGQIGRGRRCETWFSCIHSKHSEPLSYPPASPVFRYRRK